MKSKKTSKKVWETLKLNTKKGFSKIGKTTTKGLAKVQDTTTKGIAKIGKTPTLIKNLGKRQKILMGIGTGAVVGGLAIGLGVGLTQGNNNNNNNNPAYIPGSKVARYNETFTSPQGDPSLSSKQNTLFKEIVKKLMQQSYDNKQVKIAKFPFEGQLDKTTNKQTYSYDPNYKLFEKAFKNLNFTISSDMGTSSQKDIIGNKYGHISVFMQHLRIMLSKENGAGHFYGITLNEFGRMFDVQVGDIKSETKEDNAKRVKVFQQIIDVIKNHGKNGSTDFKKDNTIHLDINGYLASIEPDTVYSNKAGNNVDDDLARGLVSTAARQKVVDHWNSIASKLTKAETIEAIMQVAYPASSNSSDIRRKVGKWIDKLIEYKKHNKTDSQVELDKAKAKAYLAKVMLSITNEVAKYQLGIPYDVAHHHKNKNVVDFDEYDFGDEFVANMPGINQTEKFGKDLKWTVSNMRRDGTNGTVTADITFFLKYNGHDIKGRKFTMTIIGLLKDADIVQDQIDDDFKFVIKRLREINSYDDSTKTLILDSTTDTTMPDNDVLTEDQVRDIFFNDDTLFTSNQSLVKREYKIDNKDYGAGTADITITIKSTKNIGTPKTIKIHVKNFEKLAEKLASTVTADDVVSALRAINTGSVKINKSTEAADWENAVKDKIKDVIIEKTDKTGHKVQFHISVTFKAVSEGTLEFEYKLLQANITPWAQPKVGYITGFKGTITDAKKVTKLNADLDALKDKEYALPNNSSFSSVEVSDITDENLKDIFNELNLIANNHGATLIISRKNSIATQEEIDKGELFLKVKYKTGTEETNEVTFKVTGFMGVAAQDIQKVIDKINNADFGEIPWEKDELEDLLKNQDGTMKDIFTNADLLIPLPAATAVELKDEYLGDILADAIWGKDVKDLDDSDLHGTTIKVTYEKMDHNGLDKIKFEISKAGITKTVESTFKTVGIYEAIFKIAMDQGSKYVKEQVQSKLDRTKLQTGKNVSQKLKDTKDAIDVLVDKLLKRQLKFSGIETGHDNGSGKFISYTAAEYVAKIKQVFDNFLTTGDLPKKIAEYAAEVNRINNSSTPVPKAADKFLEGIAYDDAKNFKPSNTVSHKRFSRLTEDKWNKAVRESKNRDEAVKALAIIFYGHADGQIAMNVGKWVDKLIAKYKPRTPDVSLPQRKLAALDKFKNLMPAQPAANASQAKKDKYNELVAKKTEVDNAINGAGDKAALIAVITKYETEFQQLLTAYNAITA